MKRINVPDTITVKPPATPQGTPNPFELTFARWLEDLISMDERSGKTAKALFLAFDVRTKLQECVSKKETVILLSQDEYELVKQIAESPSSGYFTPVAIQIVPFVRAVLQATDN